MMKQRASLSLALIGACAAYALLAGCASSSPEPKPTAAKESKESRESKNWQVFRTDKTSRKFELAGGSYIELAPHSSAEILTAARAPLVHLNSGAVTMNLARGAGVSAKLTTSQLFVRASEGWFFVSFKPTEGTAIGVCEGQVTAFAEKRGATETESGAFTVAAGEQGMVRGNGTVFKEQDPEIDCSSAG
jgi:ferric-dicitrate binding protein FerR (iron transport regulator)